MSDKRQPTAEQTEALRVSAILGGCTCTPDITLHDVGGGVLVAGVLHDAGCGHKLDSGTAEEFARSLLDAKAEAP